MYNEELFLITELLVWENVLVNIRNRRLEEMQTFFIIVEALQKIEKFILVPPEDSLDLGWFFRICNEHLLHH